ncbi:MAG: hypothetical protein ACOC7U_06530, partial [Spirochaetota bacterium]
SSLPGADAVIFPKLVREAYRQLDTFRNMGCPVIIATSEFGTVSMWDWEIASFLKSHRVRVFTPYSVELTRAICRALGLKTEMQQTSFLMFQDTPGEGMQASIFKRFFWWEEDCIRLIKQKFGIEITKKSFQSLGQQAQKIPDHEAEEVIKRRDIHTRDVPPGALKSAVKIYLAVKKETEADESIGGVGMNCLNESFYSDSTPCLAWSLLFEEKGLMWACEADIMSLLTKHLVYRTLRVPVMMSNIYPFLVGMAALKHERIDSFPEVDEPEHHLLAAHCGYLGVVPRPFAARWTLRPRVLEIVNENATAIDARLPEGKLTLVKIDPALSRIQVVEGELEGYVQYPGSDCRNGALIKIPNGYNLMDSFYSHHNCLAVGHIGEGVKVMARALGLEVDEVK